MIQMTLNSTMIVLVLPAMFEVLAEGSFIFQDICCNFLSA